MRKVVLMGNKDKGIRFVFRMAEVGVLRVMEQHEQHPNVSSGIIIMNLDGFNSKQHGCPECTSYTNFMLSTCHNFDSQVHNISVVE